MKLTKQQRLARLKPAVEIVEDELNRLPPPGEGRDYDLADAMYAVIRHLKARWGELSADGASDAPQSPQTHETGRG